MVIVELPVYIRLDNIEYINPERITLLRKVASTGSLFSAAKQISISYQKAWTLIDDMNKKAPKPLIVKKRGGSGGGGAEITEYGKLILNEYEFIEQQVKDFTKKLNNEINF